MYTFVCAQIYEQITWSRGAPLQPFDGQVCQPNGKRGTFVPSLPLFPPVRACERETVSLFTVALGGFCAAHPRRQYSQATELPT